MLTFEDRLQLRPYQEEALDALWRAWERGQVRHPLIVLPTGAGKSPTMAELCRRGLDYPNTRILVLAHRAELVQQNAEAIEKQTGLRCGVFSAGLGSRETGFPVTVASIDSIWKLAPELDPFDIIIIDECHRIPTSGTGKYRTFLDQATLQNPDVRFIGFTATPFRMGTGRLDKGDDALFDGIVYEAKVSDLIAQGFLSEVISKGGITRIDVSGVKIRGGEYVASDLARAADKEDVTKAAVAEIVELGRDRKGWIIFAAGVEHAEHILAEVRSHGIESEIVTGKTPATERAHIIRRFKERRTRCLVSVEVFLEGFNAPHVDLIGMLRPTKSPVLYIQAVGRGLRRSPGKDNCLLLDYAGVVSEMGPIDRVHIHEPRQKGDADGPPGVAPAKECPECRTIVATATRVCPGCGHEYPPPDVNDKLKTSAYGGAVLSNQQELMEVNDMVLSRWEPSDPNRPNTLLVTYRTNLRDVREWLCPEHPDTSYARVRFEHRCRTEWKIDPPDTIADMLALADELPVPVAILVRQSKENPKFLDILRRFYG